MARFPPPEKDIEAALRHARLVEAAPDFAGLTDVAQVPGLPRQNLHKLMNKNRHSVPAPARPRMQAAPPSGTWPTCCRGCMQRAPAGWNAA